MERQKYQFVIRRIGLLALALFAFLFYPTILRAQTEGLRPLPLSIIEIKDQPGCPIVLEPDKVEAPADDRSVELSIGFRFASTKTISGYVILFDSHTKEPPISLPAFRAADMIKSSAGFVRYPVKSEGTDLPGKIIVSIDFVSFTDGTTWGDDTIKKSVWVDGATEGARAALVELERVSPANDPDRVQKIQDFSKAHVSSVPEVPENEKGTDWKAGFKTGYWTLFASLNAARPMKRDTFLNRFEEVRARLIGTTTLNP